jgi:hypothetical protein
MVSKKPTPVSGRGINWRNLGSFRLAMAAFFVALLFAVPASLVSSLLATIAFVLAILLVYAYALLNPGFQAYCPHCRRRVRLGSGTCHHCGRRVTD